MKREFMMILKQKKVKLENEDTTDQRFLKNPTEERKDKETI